MATLMKELMDTFYALARSERDAGRYELAFVFDTAESLANECHGMNNDDVREFLALSFKKNQEKAPSPEEQEAWALCLLALED